MIRRLILRGATLNVCKTYECEGEYIESRSESSAETALYLICKNDGKGCPTLKAALSAVQKSPDVNLLSRHENGKLRFHMARFKKKSALYVAVRRYDIEMIKLLLIHGADPVRCAVVGVREMRRAEDSYSDSEEDSDHAPAVHTSPATEEQDTVLSAFDVLDSERLRDRKMLDDESTSRDKEEPVEAKRQIAALLKSNVKWFPELIDFYPKRMGHT